MPSDCVTKQQDGGWWEDQLANRCRFPIGPVNTWTNVAYLLAGAAVMWQTKAWSGAVEALMLGLLGVGSALYHGFKTQFGGACDDVGMLMVFGALTIYAYAPLNPWTPWIMTLTGLGMAVWRFLSVRSAQYLYMILGMTIGSATMAAALHGHPGQALLGTGLLAVAYFGCWKPDHARTFPWPRWGHGLWHVLTATGIAILFLAL